MAHIVYCDPKSPKVIIRDPNATNDGNVSIPAGIRTRYSVLVNDGQFSWRMPLMSAGAIHGISWSFELNYLSSNGVDGLVSLNFNYPDNLYLKEQTNGDLLLGSGQNTFQTFEEASAGVFEPSADANATLAVIEKSGSGSAEIYTMTSNKGVETVFFGFDNTINTPGKLKSITDKYGNSQTYTWQVTSGVIQLTTVTDSYGRDIDYTYYGSTEGYRLKQIEDFIGRKLNFQYDTDGRLVAVITPSITQAVTGNTYPRGTAYVFQYDTTNSRTERQDDLIKIWYPNQTATHMDATDREVDVSAVYTNATPRYFVEYGQDPTDDDTWGRVIRETVGDTSNSIGGIYSFSYSTSSLPTNIIDSGDPIVFQTTVTDRNGNQVVYDFNGQSMLVHKEVLRTRNKNSLEATSYETWTKFNARNQALVTVYPEGNSVEYEYEDGTVTGITGTYYKRAGLKLRETHKPGNSISIPSRAGSNGQTELTYRYFYDPLFNNVCAVIEERGNPIDGTSTYFTPQNGGTTPTNTDRSRYATIQYMDYQKNQTTTVKNNTALQTMLGLTATEIEALIDHVDGQMKATGGSGGLPAGFEMDLGDINGDGTGDGNSSGLSASQIRGDVVKVKMPSVREVDATTQVREELYTYNARGQVTTYTDPEGNVTVTLRYPENDPEGDGLYIASGLSSRQYGYVKEVIVDADPTDVMTLEGSDGDMTDFVVTGVSPRDDRTNTPSVYQELSTKYEGSTAGGACAACAYDSLGNPLAVTDARGFVTTFERNEMGVLYRQIAPAPYNFKTEYYFDANRNVTRVDVEDKVVKYTSSDPTSASYAKFVPTGTGSTAQVPVEAGSGGSVRSGWFTSLFEYDLLDNQTEADLDATGSTPSSLVTTFAYDANENLIKVILPAGNTVEYDYDERDLRIATRVGYDASISEDGAVSVWVYDKNSNLEMTIGPAARGGAGNQKTVVIADAFSSSSSMTHTGDWVVENTHDGFDRLIKSTDAAGNVYNSKFDPGGRTVETSADGPISGVTPTNRTGTGNKELTRSLMRYDEAGRNYDTQDEVFVATSTSLPSGRSVTHKGGGLKENSTADDHTGTVTIVSSGSATTNRSYVLSRTVFDRKGRPISEFADNATEMETEYDGADRAIKQTDALSNVVEMVYDGNSNLIESEHTEVCTITQPTVADEVFKSKLRYDCLSRLVVKADQGADGTISDNLSDAQTLFTLIGYDSRNNSTLLIDPKENTTLFKYDGASRQIQVDQHLRVNGQGSNGPLPSKTFLSTGGSVIVTKTQYDGDSRVTHQIDDRGADTAYVFDTLNRVTKMTFHDSTKREYEYDEASDLTKLTDENVSVFDYTYDALGRRTDATITKAMGVVGTTAQTFEYDGLGRVTESVDANATVSPICQFYYDSLNRLVEDSQKQGSNVRKVTQHAFESYPSVGFTFPDGRQLTNAYDDLYRRTLVEETSGGADITLWEYFGPSRVAEVTLGNGLICTHMNNARDRSAIQSGQATPGWGNQSSDRLGYDGASRPITKRYLDGGINVSTHAYNNTSAITGWTTEYDHASNKLFERELHAESRSHLYEPFVSGVPQGGYDSPNRLRQYERGTLASGGGSVSTAIGLTNTDTIRTYDLDGLGNWSKTVFTPVGGASTTENRTHNMVNELTQRNAGTAVNLTFDSNGNVKDDGTRTYKFDALNRVSEVARKSDGLTIAEYLYDAGGRRVRKEALNGGLSGTQTNQTLDYLYTVAQEAGGDVKLSQCVEERLSSTDAVQKQYVWGVYVDELIQQKNLVTVHGKGVGDYYVLQDLLYRTTALTDSTAALVEAYDTDAYGNTLIFNAAGTGGNWFASDATQTKVATCEFIFTGRRYDLETEIYFYRARYYDPEQGRFISRDPVGYEEGMNLYQYVEGNPVLFVDPNGDSPQAIGAAILAAFLIILRRLMRSKLNKAAKCASINAAYKSLECMECLGNPTQNQIKINIGCLMAEIAGRAAYLKLKCDYVLPGSIARGSKKAESGHRKRLANRVKEAAKCQAKLIADPC